MAFNDDDPIWYASYGSNCLAARFAAYLTGTRALGTTRGERGARNSSPPARSEAHWFGQTVRFLGNSKKWGGGGVAFLDHEPGARSPGRRYLITKGQFDDVAAQESGRDRKPLPIADLVVGTVAAIGEGFYDGLLALEPVDGIPVVTFTSPEPLDDRPPTSPSAAYLGTILRGLDEVHAEGPLGLAAVLAQAPGIAGNWPVEAIAALAK